jgi:hypothetical protein
MAMNTIEETFIKTFVTRDRRESWLHRLAAPKTRIKQLHRLSHSFDRDLDHRYLYDKEHPPAHVAVKVERLLTEWKKFNRHHLCHIIAFSSKRDGQLMNLEEAETDYSLTFGAVIVVIPDRLAYYHTERSNLSQQPFYILFRP